MSWLNQIAANEPLLKQLLLVFTLVLSRTSGLLMTAPVLGTRDVPLRVRALLAFTLAVLITPTQLGVLVDEPSDAAALVLEPVRSAAPIDWGTGTDDPGNLVNYLVVLGSEIVLGVAMGLGILLLFIAVQVAGQIIGQMSGMAVPNVLNPTLESDVPLLSQLLHVVTLAVFVTIGGHREVMDALLATFGAVPLGGGEVSATLVDTLITVATESFALGIRIAAPVATALLLSTVVLGLIGRTLPQLNILVVGFGLNTMISLATLSLSLGALGWLFQDQFDVTLGQLFEAVTSTSAKGGP